MDSIDTVKTLALPAASAASENPPQRGGKDLPPAGNTPPPEPRKVEKIDLSGVVRQIENYLSGSRRSLNFRVDETSGQPVITVINPESGEIIRQIPSEEALRMAASIARGDTRLIDTLA